MGKRPQNFNAAVKIIIHELKNLQYAIRGTAGLLLQGMDMNVDDIDILCSKETALKCNDSLKKFMVEKVDYKESDKFKSYYGKFNIEKVQTEIMGNWQIKNRRGKWSAAFQASPSEITYIKKDKMEIPVTRIETELQMFMLMGRWNAYHKIKKQNDVKINSQQPLL